MSTGLDPRPTATTFDVERLVTMAWKGQIRVPHFQRDFRWTQRDVLRLFDSIIRGYPIGSLLLWLRAAPAGTVRLGALEIDAPSFRDAFWVVDGQQRITSLANALHPGGAIDPRFKIGYDLEREAFTSRLGNDSSTVVPLPVVFDLRSLVKWFSERPEVADRLPQAAAVTSAIRQFQIPAYQVAEADSNVLQDIFDRMNNSGKRLSRAEVFSALFAGDEETKEERLSIDRIADDIDADLGFGRIDQDTVLRAILARRGPDVLREIRLEFPDRGRSEFPGESPENAYIEGAAALRRAVRFLQEAAGVPHVSFLPYRYLLIVLVRLFAHHPGVEGRNLGLLRRWYWRAALVGPEPFKGSPSAVRFLCGQIRPGDLSRSVQNLLAAVDRPEPRLPLLTRFRTNEAAGKIVLGAWWDAEPRSLPDGESFDRTQLSATLEGRATAAEAVRSVVPGRSLPGRYRTWAANRILLPSDDVPVSEIDRLISEPPPNVDPPRWASILRSHGITLSAAEQLSVGNVEGFLELRQETLEADLQIFLSRECSWRFESTPPLDELVIEDLDEDIDDGD